MAKKKLPPRPDNAAADILAILNDVAYGHSPHQVFRDWVEVTNCLLDELPQHFERMIAAHKESAVFDLAASPDSPATQAVFARLRRSYEARHFTRFAETFACLLQSTGGPGETVWQDVPGTIFESWELTNDRSGQFFTPMNVCFMMGKMMMLDIEAQVKERFQAAAEKSGLAPMLGVMAMLEGEVGTDSTRSPFSSEASSFSHRLLPLVAQHFEPITVCDCCVGAGRLLLGAAAAVPPRLLPFIRFYGQDIDPLCVGMSRLNLRLYGLNGYGIKCVNALTDQEIAVMPEPQASAAREVVAAAAEHEAVADDASAARVVAARREYLAVNGQLQMFDFAEPGEEVEEVA